MHPMTTGLYSYRLLDHAYINRVAELVKVIMGNCYLPAAKVKVSWLHSDIFQSVDTDTMCASPLMYNMIHLTFVRRY